MNECQCNNSMICKSTTCHHAKPHSPDYPHNCDKPAPCGQWPENPNFQPMVKCIPVDQVKQIDDCPDCGKEESKGHHPKECINVIKQKCDQLKAAVLMAMDAFQKYEMAVDTYPTVDHVRMMEQLNGVLVKHDAEVIEKVASQLAIDGRNYCHDRMEYQSGYLAASMDVYTMANQLRKKSQCSV